MSTLLRCLPYPFSPRWSQGIPLRIQAQVRGRHGPRVPFCDKKISGDLPSPRNLSMSALELYGLLLALTDPVWWHPPI